MQKPLRGGAKCTGGGGGWGEKKHSCTLETTSLRVRRVNSGTTNDDEHMKTGQA